MFNIVENDKFRALFEAHDSKLSITSSATVKSRIEQVYYVRKHNISSNIQAMSSYCLSLDAWTCPNEYTFLGIIARFIIEQFDYNEEVLDFI